MRSAINWWRRNTRTPGGNYQTSKQQRKSRPKQKRVAAPERMLRSRYDRGLGYCPPKSKFVLLHSGYLAQALFGKRYEQRAYTQKKAGTICPAGERISCN